MAGLSQKDQKRLLDHVEKQGVVVTPTTKGYLMRMPDGGTAMLHKTQSDRMAPMALRAKLKRHGVSWPWDGGKATLPKYITDGTMRQSTIDRYRDVILDGGELPDEVFPNEVVTAEFKLRNPDADPPRSYDLATCYRALYRLGYVSGGRFETKRGKSWVLKPVEVEEPPVPEAKPFAPASMFTPEVVETTPEVNPSVEAEVTEPAVETPPAGGREFLDTVESWTVDTSALTGLTMTVEQMFAMYRAAGLEVEVRVWRA